MFRKKEEKQPGKRMGAQMGRSAREQKRKTGGLRFGLRAQMLCGLLGIFAFSVAILSWISGRQLTANREAQIARELSVIRENTEIHVRQLLILNEANNDEESFQSLAEDMVQELGNTGMDSLAVCSRDGELLAGRLERPGGNQPAAEISRRRRRSGRRMGIFGKPWPETPRLPCCTRATRLPCCFPCRYR